MLWSLKLVRLGVTRGFGAGLQQALSLSTSNRFVALFMGALVTMFLQSSTAVVMIITSFAGQAMISTSASLALILGADIGTTIVAQLLSFDVSWMAPVAILVGVCLFSFDKISRAKNIGRILIGLGLLLFSLRFISESSLPLKESEALPLILAPLQNDNALAILVAMLMTWMAHSSLAIVLVLMSLTAGGVLPVGLALIMVLGVNLGATIAPFIATLRDSPAAMRVPAGNMMMRFIGVCAVLPLMNFVTPYLADISGDDARQIVNFHMAFNIALALCFLPLIGVIAKICTKLLPDRPDSDDPSRPKYLNEKGLDTPAIALTSAERETLRMADVLQEMLEDTINAFKSNDEKIVHDIREKDDIIDKLYGALKHYMAKLSQEMMNKKEADRFVQIITFATNLEHAGDIIDKNLMPLALKKIRNQRNFSQEGFKEIEDIHNAVLDSVRLAQNVFISGNLDLARKMLEEKELTRRAEITASTRHIARLREGRPETIATTSLHLDIIRDYRRINSYMCTVAFPLLEAQGYRHSFAPKEEGAE